VTLEQLHDLQCYLEGIGPEVLFSRSRKWDVIKHRKAFCVVARGYKITYREIGQYLAGFDHSTIVHNVQGFEYELGEKRDELQLLVDRLSGKISDKPLNFWVFPGLEIKVKEKKKRPDRLSPGMRNLLNAINAEPWASDFRLKQKTGLAKSTIQKMKRKLKPYLS
jgi:hypothetical protein